MCRNRLSAKLNTVVVLQSMTNGMGDLWQVVAITEEREKERESC